jgi:hypothetical protein
MYMQWQWLANLNTLSLSLPCLLLQQQTQTAHMVRLATLRKPGQAGGCMARFCRHNSKACTRHHKARLPPSMQHTP